MVKNILKEIVNTDGVNGVFIASNKADIVGKAGLEYSDKQLTDLTTHILRLIAAFQLKGKKTTELEFYWQNQYIICKNSDHFIVVVFCGTPNILAFVRITLNVTVANLLDDKKFSKWLKSHIADRDFVLRKSSLDKVEQLLLDYVKQSS